MTIDVVQVDYVHLIVNYKQPLWNILLVATIRKICNKVWAKHSKVYISFIPVLDLIYFIDFYYLCTCT
jgi:hypothetical protein